MASNQIREVKMDPKKVLVIDDEQDLCFLIKTILEETGQYKVSVAFTCFDGLVSCLRELPDLVFLDYVMPRERGDSVINFLKVNQRTKQIPIVLMSGLGEAICFEKTELNELFFNSPAVKKDSGASGAAWQEMPADIVNNFGVEIYLPKPFSRQILVEVTQKILFKKYEETEQPERKIITDEKKIQ